MATSVIFTALSSTNFFFFVLPNSPLVLLTLHTMYIHCTLSFFPPFHFKSHSHFPLSSSVPKARNRTWYTSFFFPNLTNRKSLAAQTFSRKAHSHAHSLTASRSIRTRYPVLLFWVWSRHAARGSFTAGYMQDLGNHFSLFDSQENHSS